MLKLARSSADNKISLVQGRQCIVNDHYVRHASQLEACRPACVWVLDKTCASHQRDARL